MELFIVFIMCRHPLRFAYCLLPSGRVCCVFLPHVFCVFLCISAVCILCLFLCIWFNYLVIVRCKLTDSGQCVLYIIVDCMFQIALYAVYSVLHITIWTCLPCKALAHPPCLHSPQVLHPPPIPSSILCYNFLASWTGNCSTEILSPAFVFCQQNSKNIAITFGLQ